MIPTQKKRQPREPNKQKPIVGGRSAANLLGLVRLGRQAVDDHPVVEGVGALVGAVAFVHATAGAGSLKRFFRAHFDTSEAVDGVFELVLVWGGQPPTKFSIVCDHVTNRCGARGLHQHKPCNSVGWPRRHRDHNTPHKYVDDDAFHRIDHKGDRVGKLVVHVGRPGAVVKRLIDGRKIKTGERVRIEARRPPSFHSHRNDGKPRRSPGRRVRVDSLPGL